ncbi:hypothetical protein [Granulicella sp. S156]|jgi:hypothetical protein|uniref:hypothetical protein n=1 Tax=Granulicella sp. S156 TaxID=1747224 RepID=UPI00131ACFCF|nr:hypothetical protein [Granulicella sp. S156]
MKSSIHLVHLSDDQILNTLSGDVSAGVAAHLANCSICSRRVAEAEAPIASFKAVTLAWSERRSATLPLQPPAAPPLAWHRRAVMAATATAALLVGISVPLVRNEAPSAPVVTSPATATPSSTAEVATVSTPALTAAMQHKIPEAPAAVETAQTKPQDEQIARDNQMLQNIDRALDNSVESPADTYELQPISSQGPARERAKTLEN